LGPATGSAAFTEASKRNSISPPGGHPRPRRVPSPAFATDRFAAPRCLLFPVCSFRGVSCAHRAEWHQKTSPLDAPGRAIRDRRGCNPMADFSARCSPLTGLTGFYSGEGASILGTRRLARPVASLRWPWLRTIALRRLWPSASIRYSAPIRSLRCWSVVWRSSRLQFNLSSCLGTCCKLWCVCSASSSYKGTPS
jgi:hypothetical protein